MEEKYKYENGKYYRKSSDGNWFEVNRNKDGYLLWKLPDGKTVYDPEFRVPEQFILNVDSKSGTYLVPTGANGSYGRYNSLKDASNAYYKAKGDGSFSDPGVNIANDLIFDALTGKGIVNFVTNTAKAAPTVIKTGWNTVKNTAKGLLKKETTKQVAKETAKKAASKTGEFLVREVPRTIVGGLTGAAGDYFVMKPLTGKTWEGHIQDFAKSRYGFELPYWLSGTTNPFFWGGYGWTDQAVRRAYYNQVTPFGYNNSLVNKGVSPLGKKEELILMLKDIPKFAFKKPWSKMENDPDWMIRIKSLPNYDPNDWTVLGLARNDILLSFRDEAQRLAALGESYLRTPLYIRNKNGIYSYNLDYIRSLGNRNLLNPNFYDVSTGKWIGNNLKSKTSDPHYMDRVTMNGGGVNGKVEGDTYFFKDEYNMEPFKEEFRLPPFKFGNWDVSMWMNRHAPYFGADKALGVKPFWLELEVPLIWK